MIPSRSKGSIRHEKLSCAARDAYYTNVGVFMADHLSNLADAEMLSSLDTAARQWDANLGDYPGVTQAMVDELKDLVTELDDGLTDFVAKSAAKKAARARKDDIRSRAETKLRRVRKIAKAGGASAAALAALGTEHSTRRSSAEATVPFPTVDTSHRLQHTIHWKDQAVASRRKPAGVMGAEIWAKIGGQENDGEGEFRYVTIAPVTPFVVAHVPADVGKMAHYMLRWRLSDGSLGGWGKTVSATITG